MRANFRKRVFFSVLLSFALCAFCSLPLEVKAEGSDSIECSFLEGSNANNHRYGPGRPYWSKPTYSYLTTVGSRYMRVQGHASGHGTTVVYYDSEFNTIERMELSQELPIFGGFFESAQNYYLVTGQENPEEDDSKEVIRITKFDKEWSRVGSCGLQGGNTTVPFDGGNCRMDFDGKYLAIHTSHEM